MGVHTTARHGYQSESHHVLDSIRRLVQDLRVADREAKNTLGLSGAQLFVIKRLGEKSSMSVNELAERTYTHQSSVSVVAHRLVEKRLVQRGESASDRRRAELSLTADGKKLLSRSLHSPQDRMIEAIDSMPPENRKQLAIRLAELVEAMGLSSQTPAMFFEAEAKAASARKSR